jgi:hypothetical protein
MAMTMNILAMSTAMRTATSTDTRALA